MKKFVPALIAIVLIIMIAGGGFIWKLVDKYSYSKEQQDLAEYYQIVENDQAAIILQNEQIKTQAKIIDGNCYLELQEVQSLLNDRFYYDAREGLLLFTTPTQLIKNEVGTSTYYIDNEANETNYAISVPEGEKLYIALDFVRLYTNFDYTLYQNPNRISLRTEWGERTVSTIKRKTKLRVKGGIKSPILRPLQKNETVVVLEEMEKWTKIKTEDAMIGYVENRFLTPFTTEQEIGASHYEEPEYTSIHRDYKINLAWHHMEVAAGNRGFEDRVSETGSLNVISPTWFTIVDNDGNISSLASMEYVKQAHSRNMEVWPLISNFSKDVNSYEVLSYTSKRTALIDTLMEKAKTYGFDGINVDFEGLDSETGPHFVQFLRELSIACRLNQIVLSVDNYVPKESTAHYDRHEQGIVADYIIIMGYDEHWGGGGIAGSVASIGFVEEGIQKTIEEVPSQKVVNAIPFYSRVWKTSGGEVTSKALGMEGIQKYIQENDIPMEWNEECCQYYGEKEKGEKLYQIWQEDAKSIETKLTVMQKYDLGGVAAWKLGLEDKEIWKVIDAYVQS